MSLGLVYMAVFIDQGKFRERMYQENAFCVLAKLSFIFCVETQNIIKDQTEYFRVHTCFV